MIEVESSGPPADDDDLLRARLREAADEAFDRLEQSGRLVAHRSVQLALEKFGHTRRDYLVRAAVAGMRDLDSIPNPEDRDALIGTAARALVDAAANLPTRLAETEMIMRRYGGNEDAAKVLYGTLRRLPEIRSLRSYVYDSVQRERGRRLQRAAKLLPLVATHDGEEWVHEPASTAAAPDDVVLRSLDLAHAAASMTACPACAAKDASCPDDIDRSWWLRAAIGDRPAQHIVDEGMDRTPAFAGDTVAARDQNRSRKGYHASGTLLHVFAFADDRRLGDPTLIDLGERHHGRRCKLLLQYNQQRVTPEARRCSQLEWWCGWQTDRMSRHLPVLAKTFPTLVGAP